jgi:hypothetical protein
MADDFVLVEPTVIRNTHGGRRRGAGHPRGAYKALVTESTEAIQAEVASVGPEIVRQHIGLALKLERYLANGNAKMAKLAVTCGVGLLRFLVPKNNGPLVSVSVAGETGDKINPRTLVERMNRLFALVESGEITPDVGLKLSQMLKLGLESMQGVDMGPAAVVEGGDGGPRKALENRLVRMVENRPPPEVPQATKEEVQQLMCQLLCEHAKKGDFGEASQQILETFSAECSKNPPDTPA